MRKDNVISRLGGSAAEAARRLGIGRQSVAGWEVDDDGHIVSRAVADRVLAYFVRERARVMREQGMTIDPIEADFVYLPEQEEAA